MSYAYQQNENYYWIWPSKNKKKEIIRVNTKDTLTRKQAACECDELSFHNSPKQIRFCVFWTEYQKDWIAEMLKLSKNMSSTHSRRCQTKWSKPRIPQPNLGTPYLSLYSLSIRVPFLERHQACNFTIPLLSFFAFRKVWCCLASQLLSPAFFLLVILLQRLRSFFFFFSNFPIVNCPENMSTGVLFCYWKKQIMKRNGK